MVLQNHYQIENWKKLLPFEKYTLMFGRSLLDIKLFGFYLEIPLSFFRFFVPSLCPMQIDFL